MRRKNLACTKSWAKAAIAHVSTTPSRSLTVAPKWPPGLPQPHVKGSAPLTSICAPTQNALRPGVCAQDTGVDQSGSVIEQLFGVGLHTRLVCAESGEAVEEDSTVYELKCNITVEVNHLSEGIRLGLQDDREKNSEALGRLALFAVKLSGTCS